MCEHNIKLLALDLDGTLAAINTRVSDETIKLLNSIHEKGIAIAILSGKPTAYLTGLARQIGIKEIILSGENGAEVQFGLSYPPKYSYCLVENKANYQALLDTLIDKYKEHIWIQPNRFNLSVFAEQKILQEINLLFNEYSKDKNNIISYFHADCVELVDKSISKGNALNFIIHQLNIEPSAVCAIGDGDNDIELLQQSTIRLSINKPLNVDNLQIFKSIDLALTYLMDVTQVFVG
jgi:hydroxymethylpyrimidine pyrophosphatase-like HAD family hydrolase